ncbi:MAG: DUF3341 domain-containing protein [Acidobacteriota bacterium]|nr:DUF3341 domain-containing protein [Acidobacteriota bacterium]
MSARTSSGDLGTYGLLIEFDDPEELVAACRQVRDEGFQRWDAYTPFPIHGMDRAMGIRPTRLPLLILAGGLTGLTVALLMQWWMNAVDYPFLISGKPLFGLPANIPVTFELTVLFSALTAFFGLWGRTGMPRLYHPVFKSERFRRVTADRFFIVLEASDSRFDLQRTQEFAESLGGVHVERLEE